MNYNLGKQRDAGGGILHRVVLASPELRMAPLGSDNFDPNADLRTRQYTLNQEKSGLDFGVHYIFCNSVNLSKRVRRDHPLRKIAELIDFDFIYNEVEDMYG